MDLSRRSFLKGAALGGASLASFGLVAGCSSPSTTDVGTAENDAAANVEQGVAVHTRSNMEPADETYEGDVVVLGCGPGGIACSTKLAESGAKVLMVEKTSIIGGTGLVASGNCYIALNSEYQLSQGLEADIPAFYAEWLEAVHYHCDHEVLSRYLQNCGRVVDWLLSYGFGFQMKDTQPTNGLSGHAYRISQPAKDSGNREETYEKMMDVVTSAGGAIHTECLGKELIVDDTQTVVGIRTENGAKTVDFIGKAVVIASGGYGANQEMINTYASVPLLGRDPVQNNGEGAQMAWAAGAKKPWNLGALCIDTLYPVDSNFTSYYGGIQALGNVMKDAGKAKLHVNQLGKRFHSEDAFCWVPTYAGANAVAYEEPWLFVIADQQMIDALKEEDPEKVTDAYLEEMEAMEVLYKGETAEALAEAAGWDPQVFKTELDTYTGYCATGSDPVFFKDTKFLIPYGEGPYYAARLAPTPFGTCGDLSVTPKMEVRGQESGSVVPGLFAVGTETVGTMHNDYYWALGQTVGWAHTSGVLAAEEIAASVL